MSVATVTAPSTPSDTRSAPTTAKIGVALAGGGPLGAIWELGALNALADCLQGLQLDDADTYVGVSAGGLLAAALANGMRPRQIAQLFIEDSRYEEPFDPAMLLKPDVAEYLRRLRLLPSLVWSTLKDLVTRRHTSTLASFERFGRVVPTGVFSNDTLDAYLARVFDGPGRTNDFRQLRKKLVLVATDLESGEAIEFGSPGRDDARAQTRMATPISVACKASAALPGLFPPVLIDGRYYVDGALKKTLHASVALREGCKLVICLNPLVPYDGSPPEPTPNSNDTASSTPAAPESHLKPTDDSSHRIIEGGLPTVLSQTFRAIIQSRLTVGIEKYRATHPDADVVLFEPDRNDADLFFTNLFSYSGRRRLAEHAYQVTRRQLLDRADELAPLFARHGLTLDRSAAADPSLHLLRPQVRAQGAGRDPKTRPIKTFRRLSQALDLLERKLEMR